MTKSDKNYDEARMLFLNYNGSYYGMWHDGEIDKYKQFDIPKELEQKWLMEELDKRRNMINDIKNMNQFIHNFLRYTAIVQQMKCKNDLYYIKKYINERKNHIDAYTLNLCIKEILELIDIEKNKINKQKYILNMLKMLNDLLDNGITISDDYKKDGKFPDYVSEEIVKKNIIQTIELCRKKLKEC